MGFYSLKYYYRLRYAYQECYHLHQIVVFSKPTFVMTQMEIILDHVVNQAHVELKRWKQLMDYCQELVCFTNLGFHVMETIMWKVNCECTKFLAIDAHLGQDALYLQAAILHTQHLVDKLTSNHALARLHTTNSVFLTW